VAIRFAGAVENVERGVNGAVTFGYLRLVFGLARPVLVISVDSFTGAFKTEKM
jgi:hypothetical protein